MDEIIEMKTDKRKEIFDYIKDNGRKFSWVSEQTGINYNTLMSILKHQTIKLSDENKAKINKVLGTNF